jgi:apolipoprotein N-acyltransferase
MLLTRYVVTRKNSWYAIFAFPVFFTTFEYFVIKFSRDGTAASLAYSQMNFLPIIQIAAITGILGITFMVTFIPSAIALGWHYREEKTKLRYITVVAGVIIGAVLLFGVIRINSSDDEKDAVKVGVLVLNEDSHIISQRPDFEKEKKHVAAYASQVAKLAAQGAKLVVLPERAMNINKALADSIIGILASVAKQNHVYIVAGYTNFRNPVEHNSALMMDAEGNEIEDYNKVHMIVGLESEFTPGNKPGLFKFNDLQAGTAICKDLDFQDYIRQYGQGNTAILCVPAWDFIVDDWLHSRMAILRGVENGFSEVRSARQGRLTISDPYGRVTSEASCANKQLAALTGYVSPRHLSTLYAHFGDWFGIINALVAIGFILIASTTKRFDRF